MVTEMCPVQSWPGQNGKALRMPKLQSATLSPRRAHFKGMTNSVPQNSKPSAKNNNGISFLPEPLGQKKNLVSRNGISPNSKRTRYVHQAAAFPTLANGTSATSSQTSTSPYPIRKSRPNTMGSFPCISSPRSLPSQLSLYDSLTRESTRYMTRVHTRNITRDHGQGTRQLHVGREPTRISLKREPTILTPSTHGFHPRSHSPTYKNLIDVKEYLEALLAKEIKEFIKTTEGIRARNNSVYTEAPSTVTFQTTLEERRASSSMLHEYFEPDVHTNGIDSTTVGEADSLHSDFTESRESLAHSKHTTSQYQSRSNINIHFDLTYLREHLNDSKLLNLDIAEIEKNYKLKHKPEKKKPKKTRPKVPLDSSLLKLFPVKKHRRKKIKKVKDETAIAEEEESQISSPEEDEVVQEYVVDLVKTFSESLTETEVESESDFEVESTPEKSIIDVPMPRKSIINVPLTIDNIDEKMAQTSETLKSTFKRISEAEKKAAAEKPVSQAVEEEPPPEPQPLTAEEKYKKMKDRLQKRKQQRAVTKESYLQYSLQLEQIKRMNDEFVDDDTEGGNMLASMTFKKIDSIMKYKTKKVGRLGLEVPESDSDESEADDKEHKDGGADDDDNVTEDGEESET